MIGIRQKTRRGNFPVRHVLPHVSRKVKETVKMLEWYVISNTPYFPIDFAPWDYHLFTFLQDQLSHKCISISLKITRNDLIIESLKRRVIYLPRNPSFTEKMGKIYLITIYNILNKRYFSKLFVINFHCY